MHPRIPHEARPTLALSCGGLAFAPSVQARMDALADALAGAFADEFPAKAP